ncbi:dnaJ [Symbiodinium microadriaticum]|nr:dnaJ [Symbiodinium microadriaticum]
MIGNHLVCIWVSAVPVQSLGLLLGRDALDGLGGVLDFGRKSLSCRLFDELAVPLERLSAGHLPLKLIPDAWPSSVKTRFRRVGPDGVLECSLDCRVWARHLLQTAVRPHGPEPHNHNMTEASLMLGQLAFDFVSASSPSARAMTVFLMAFAPRPSAAPTVMIEPGAGVFVTGGRWRRMVLRAVARYDWSREGLRLWLIKQPSLRWLPFPYPSVASVEQWRLQAAAMVEQRVMPRQWLAKASFTQGNLSSMSWFRSRVGLRFAFLEDPILAGMLASKNQPGRAARLKNAALKEAAEVEGQRVDRERVARTLIGPRGGLPTLKSDLVKLAALLHVEVKDKDTIATLKEKMKGVVGALCQRVPYVKPDAEPSITTPAASSSMVAPRAVPMRSPGPATQGPMADEFTSALPQPPAVNFERVLEEKLVEMDNRYQAMFAQVLSHVMKMQSQPQEPSSPDTEMGWDQVDAPVDGPLRVQMITQAWDKHRRDQLLISCSTTQVREAMALEVKSDYLRGMRRPFVMDVFAGTCAETKAQARGHFVVVPGAWDLDQRAERLQMIEHVRHHRPYALVLTPRAGPAKPTSTTRPDSWREAATVTFDDGLGPAVMLRVLTSSQAEFDFESWVATRRSRTQECYEIVGSNGAVDYYHEVLAETTGEDALEHDGDEYEDASEDDLGEPYLGEITPAIRNAVRRVHEATGHRSPRRLARALLMSGAPPAAVQAARELKCDVCAEHRRPKARRVGTLPNPRAVGEQAHIDLLLAEDATGRVFPVCHITDAVSKYQIAGVIPDRSTQAVINFVTRHWLPLLGPPARLIADQGREFISEAFQSWCSSRSILLWITAVQAPWQNSPAERSGGILKAILATMVSDQVVIGPDQMGEAVAEACAAYNGDANAEGVSPLQCVTGRQPRLQGSVLSNFGARLAEHGLIDAEPTLASQLALREAARVAMVRLHFSQSIRRAELARSREPSLASVPQPGDTVYFWRQQRATRKGDPRLSSSSRRRRLELKRWHGPAILLALEGHSEGGPPLNAFLSFKGQVTKCCVEHIRAASSLESLAANVWEDAITELISKTRGPAVATEAADEMDGRLPQIPEEEQQADEDVAQIAGEGAPVVEAAPSEPLQPPLTAAPGTPVGQLFERPVVQHALSRARALSLDQNLQAQALRRGQPADFAAELRSAMERQSVERGLKRGSEDASVSVGVGRRPSEAFSEPPLSMRRLGNEPREVPQEIPPLPRLSSEPAGGPALVETRSVPREVPQEIQPLPRLSTEPAGGPFSSEAAGGSALVVEHPTGYLTPGFEGVTLSHDDLVNMVLQTEAVHPLLQVQAQVEIDRMNPMSYAEAERDHGSWDGRWSLPSSSQHQLLQNLGAPLPTGVPHEFQECSAALARKEYKWSQMGPKDKELWGKAAEKGWSAYVDNSAVEILSLKESQAVRKRLAQAGELDKIMVPRFVLTDKADGVRTAENPVPPQPSARLIVPGFQDRANLQGELRRDSPTGSRLSQHLLLCLTAWFGTTWSLLSCDVKSAFLKGDPFVARELYISGTNTKTSPSIPLPEGCLAKVLKGIFGLADAPRQWWLRLARALEDRGWERSAMDQATLFKWSPGRKQLEGMIVSHVDDLLFGGSAVAEASLMDVGTELGFREVQRDDFVWCGKRFTRRNDGIITLSMQEYHENLKEIHIPKHRRGSLTAELNPFEHKQLRALLGSFQWLVAQLRFDLAFQVSSLQGEKPCIGTLLRANLLCREFKSNPKFELKFRPVDPFAGGLMVVTDSSLGNVTSSGSAEAAPLEKVCSQACYYVLLADPSLMAGEVGAFNVLDMRSHRIPRVCRSSYAAETLGTEEAFEVGQLCRGFLAMVRGLPLHGTTVDPSLNSVPLTVVVDAKDVHDKGNSDTSSFGSQKSLAFTVAWLRAVLRRPNTRLRWTSTANMFVDAGTKDMDLTHLRSILDAGKWSVTYSPTFVKQVVKAKQTKVAPRAILPLPGTAVDGNDPVMGYLSKLCEQKGWHHLDQMGVNVAFGARSFRTPEPRFSASEYPYRTTFGRVEQPPGCYQWRRLSTDEAYTALPNQHSLLSERFGVLVTFFKQRAG